MRNQIMGIVGAIAIVFTLGAVETVSAQGRRGEQRIEVRENHQKPVMQGRYQNRPMHNRRGMHNRHLTIRERKAIIRQQKLAIHRQKRAIQMQRERRARRGAHYYGYAR